MADNILERVPADLVSDAKALLPNPPTSQSVVINVPRIGRVLVFFEWKQYKVHRNTSAFWTAHRAEAIDP